MSEPEAADMLPSERARFDEVCRFGQDKLEPIAQTIAASFAEDPIWQWIFDTDDAIPVETGIALGRLLVAQRLPQDEIHGFRHFGAVALWSAPAGAEQPHDDELRTRQVEQYFPQFAAQLGDRLQVTGQLMEVMHAHRPVEEHWYLGILGTHPERQSQGLGGRVLQAMIARCDRVGLPTYLESSNPRNYGFYRRHGYVETDPFQAGDSPVLQGFWRDPR